MSSRKNYAYVLILFIKQANNTDEAYLKGSNEGKNLATFCENVLSGQFPSKLVYVVTQGHGLEASLPAAALSCRCSRDPSWPAEQQYHFGRL